MQVLQTIAVSVFLTALISGSAADHDAPTVTLKNGPYYGLYNSEYHQDMFLGMPYAQPPVGDLRFRNPQPLNATWTEPKNATEYSPMCYGYGSDQWVLGNVVSEDCLTLNVVRPRGVAKDAKLPVAFWIHGGGYAEGSNRDPRYNLSLIVDQGVKMHKPFVAVNINYRLHGFGFLWGSTVKKAGVANLGLKDQRLALHWVHDNIEQFGGDPTKVTIFGESAGAGSVGNQLLAYGGRDDHLFRGAAMESLDIATPTSGYTSVETFDPVYGNITQAAGCSASNDTLDCLRHVPVEKLSNIFNSTVTSKGRFFPVIDGEFVEEAGVLQLNKGKFVHVPLLHGQNADEGSTFGRFGVNTEEDFLAYAKEGGRTDEQAKILSILYPDIPEIGVPSTLHGRPTSPFLGKMFKRASAYGGDMVMHSGRRYMSQTWAKNNVPVFAYNFDVLVNGIPDFLGSMHFQEVAFVFHNVKGAGYENAVSVNPFKNMPDSYPRLSNMMSRMWISFFVDQTPNHSGMNVEWPVYQKEDAQILVFDANSTKLAYAAPDTYRAEGIAYIQSLYTA